jgi:ankyrin repeat protein
MPLDSEGLTAIHHAAFFRHLQDLRDLLEDGVDVDLRDAYESTPLGYAANQNWVAGVGLLLEHGARINVHDCVGNTPLHITTSVEIANSLIRAGAEIDAINDRGATPLHLASKANSIEVVKLLIQGKADVHRRDRGGRTPLHYAQGNEMVTLLLAAGSKINEQDNLRETPLLRVVSAGFVQAAESLIENGADVNLSDVRRRTPLLEATNMGLSDLVLKLLEAGADCEFRNGEGKNAHQVAAERGDAKIGRVLAEHCPR